MSRYSFCFLLVAGFSLSFNVPPNSDEQGAWEITEFTFGDYTHENANGILLLESGYYTWAVYKKDNNEFIGTGGGKYKQGGNSVEFHVYFHSLQPDLVGKSIMFTKKGSGSKWVMKSQQGITITIKKKKEKVEESLQGAWRISQRKRNEEMVEIPDGARKTLKVLTKTRFQWIAFNSETGEFFGTGGGSYTLANGKYTENIEFFSRDNSRVGASLTFNYAMKADDSEWHHSGLSSKGNPIYEIWSRE